MAPENFTGKIGGFLGKPADIWSLGVCIYVYMTELLPFEGEFKGITIKNVIENDFVWPKDLNVSEELKELVGAMLNKDPLKRPTVE